MATLITGITGLLGTALVEENRANKAIKGVYIGDYRMPETEFTSYIICDISSKNKLFKNFQHDKINCIIHTAGLANTDACEKEPKKAYASNVEATKNIIDLAHLKKAKLVYISTNAVFNGKNPLYSETDLPNPINRYGAIKLECESLVKEFVKNHLIIRPILMYGFNNPNERKSFFIWILEKLRNKEKVNIVNDIFENPLLSYQCADIIWKLIDKNTSGTYHIAGRDILNRFEAASLIAREFSLDSSLINPVSSDSFPNIAPRPKNTSYNTTKIEKELGVTPLGFREGLSVLKKRFLVEEKVN